jgi:hypothetical protein
MFDELIERLTLHYTSGAYKDEVARAKHDFFDEAGIMDEENSQFEMRMTQFLEWYLFTRPLDGKGESPVKHAFTSGEFKFGETEAGALEALAGTRHSLYEFLKIRGDDVYIKDLFTGKKLVIHGSPIRVGFSREEFFDTRLIPNGEDNFIFAKAFCIHPEEASKFILGEVKKLKKSEPVLQEALMLRLMKMRYKYEQYRHLKLDHVYTNEKKVRF